MGWRPPNAAHLFHKDAFKGAIPEWPSRRCDSQTSSGKAGGLIETKRGGQGRPPVQALFGCPPISGARGERGLWLVAAIPTGGLRTPDLRIRDSRLKTPDSRLTFSSRSSRTGCFAACRPLRDRLPGV